MEEELEEARCRDEGEDELYDESSAELGEDLVAELSSRVEDE